MTKRKKKGQRRLSSPVARLRAELTRLEAELAAMPAELRAQRTLLQFDVSGVCMEMLDHGQQGDNLRRALTAYEAVEAYYTQAVDSGVPVVPDPDEVLASQELVGFYPVALDGLATVSVLLAQQETEESAALLLLRQGLRASGRLIDYYTVQETALGDDVRFELMEAYFQAGATCMIIVTAIEPPNDLQSTLACYERVLGQGTPDDLDGFRAALPEVVADINTIMECATEPREYLQRAQRHFRNAESRLPPFSRHDPEAVELQANLRQMLTVTELGLTALASVSDEMHTHLATFQRAMETGSVHDGQLAYATLLSMLGTVHSNLEQSERAIARWREAEALFLTLGADAQVDEVREHIAIEEADEA